MERESRLEELECRDLERSAPAMQINESRNQRNDAGPLRAEQQGQQPEMVQRRAGSVGAWAD